MAWDREIRGAIDAALRHGFVVVLLSPETVGADFVVAEIRHALERRIELGRQSGVIPIIASERDRTLALLASSDLEPITKMALLDFTSGTWENNLAELIKVLATE